MTHDDIVQCRARLARAVLAIQQPRSDFELENFVIGQHDTEPRRYAQCVLEIQLKLQALRRAAVIRRQTLRRVERLRRIGTPPARDKAELLEIDLEDQHLATVGAIRELRALNGIFRSFQKDYTRSELNASEADYWRARLLRQASYDVVAHGRVGVGNQDALRQIGLPVAPGRDYVSAVERSYLANGDAKIVVVVPTLIPRSEIKECGLSCLRGWAIPGAFSHAVHVVDGRTVAAAYTEGVQWAIENGAQFVLCVEDDHIIPAGAFEQLWSVYLANGPQAIVAAWYPQKKAPRTGAPIILRNGYRMHLEDDGDVHEVYSIPQGFTLIPTRVFHQIPQPWFATTDCLSQDSFFSQLARQAGYRLLVDTSVRCQHVDRQTGQIYE